MADQQQFEAELDPDICEFGSVIHTAIRDMGGFDLVMRSEAEPEVRAREIAPLLTKLGVFDLDPAGGEDQLQAAATACRAAGAFALPYPVAERLAAGSLSGPSEQSAPPAIGVADSGTDTHVLLNMGDVDLAWHAIDTTGRVRALSCSGAVAPGGRLGPFVTELAMSTGDIGVSAPAALAMITHLQSCTLLGMLESALELTVTYAGQRSQFGAPIVSYQAIQHQLADALIAIELLERHVLYGLWSLANRRANVLVDVVGTRVAGLRAADVVLRVGHQVHGATGFCDESAISWLSRHSQPLRRLPLDLPRTESWFTELTMQHGIDGLFPSRVPPAGSADRAAAS